MYYVIFRWTTGGIKFWAKCHFIYYILRSYCWSHELFEILPRIGNNIHPLFLALLTQGSGELLSSLCVRRPSVHNYLKIFSSETTRPLKTKLWWNGPLPKFCPVIPTSNQDDRHAKNREKKGGMKFKKNSSLKLLSQSQPNFAEIILGWFPSKIVSGISDLRPRWPPQPNLI